MASCNCPKCQQPGRSVASLNYAETQLWDKDGSFSGAGVGIGTFGVGVGIGGGSYSEHGQSQSKRASVYAEPVPFKLPVGSVVMGALVFGVFIMAAPSFSRFLATTVSAGESALGGMLEMMWPVVIFLFPVMAGIFIWQKVKEANRNQAEEDRLNAEVYPKRLARYNELRYCENCHLLFDESGVSEAANPLGFGKMLQREPVAA